MALSFWPLLLRLCFRNPSLLLVLEDIESMCLVQDISSERVSLEAIGEYCLGLFSCDSEDVAFCWMKFHEPVALPYL